ncbi:DUF433 domain-containing protein [Mucilaginibacter sp. OK283]|jgi:uncharacterized protein (DUF433 family)|uniref:DUF433 domain-containing protein n=1 Tax=Mucilaginibacter sp. OK283 TaxID=1881049 RepID=UPI0008C38689|nr:DUF433 domain-containing protein [Mucilaginibacter sp. OK283]SEO66439.1 Protein of unknown function [Mucilaginibacter sp. OK283]
MDIQQVVNTDQDILSGTPVFAGTRVPVESLFDHLKAGISIEEFLDEFPSVKKEQAMFLVNKEQQLNFL